MDEIFCMVVAFSPAGNPRLKAYVFWKLLHAHKDRRESLRRILAACNLHFLDNSYEQQLLDLFPAGEKIRNEEESCV